MYNHPFTKRNTMYTTMTFMKLLILGTVFFVACDLFWLGFAMKDFYKNQLGLLMRRPADYEVKHMAAALGVWLLIVLGSIMYVLPHTYGKQLIDVFAQGALYGAVVYGVYDLTNYAVLNDFSASLACVDWCWGSFANGLLALFLHYIL